jgi:nicotinamidase-related amidase
VPLVDASDSVLVIVDAQPSFIAHPTMSDEVLRKSASAVDRIAWLSGFAGLLAVPVVVVEEGADRHGSTDSRVADRLPAGTPVESRSAFSLTASDAAVDAIRATKRQTVVLVGFETDVCVAQSAIDLCDLGFRVIVPEDMTYSSSDHAHRRGLARIGHAGGEPNHFKGLIFEWLQTIERAEEFYGQAEASFGKAPLRL